MSTTAIQPRRRRALALALLAAVLALATGAPEASADKLICPTGSGKGQCLVQSNIAVDPATGRLFVADTRNNRVNVFDAAGNFERSFGWGVNGGTELQICLAAQSSCSAGIAGSGSGQLDSPVGIAIDASTSPSMVYVTDTANRRVVKFTDQGDFLLMFGGGVNQTTGEDVCLAGSGDLCGAGSAGSGEGEFQSAGLFVGVDGTGTVFVVDDALVGVSETEARLQRFDGLGALVAPQCLLFSDSPRALAVEAGGDFWVSSAGEVGEIHKFEDDCTPLFTRQIPGGERLLVDGLSLDVAGHLFASFNEARSIRKSIVEYDPEGHLTRWFGFGSFNLSTVGLAPYSSASGDIYASEASGGGSGRVLHIPFPDPGPIVLPEACKASPLGNSKATLNATLNPEGAATDYHFEYLTEADYAANGGSFSGPNPPISTPETPIFFNEIQRVRISATGGQYRLSFGPDTTPDLPHNASLDQVQAALAALPSIGPGNVALTGNSSFYTVTFTGALAETDVPELIAADGTTPLSGAGASVSVETRAVGGVPNFGLYDVRASVSPLTPETEYRCRAVATNADGTDTGPEGQFKTLAPLEIGSTWSSEVGFEEATLSAEVNPLGIPTTAYFQYVDEATYQADIAALGPEHGFDHAIQVPDLEGGQQPLELGSGETPQLASVDLADLLPATHYRYRVVATDVYISPTEVLGPTETLRTFGPGEETLPDERAHEMVSPPAKNTAEAGVPGAAGGLSNERFVVRIQAAADSGQALTYTSFTSFGDPQGSSIASQYLSRRGPDGWGTENISPPGFMQNALNAPYLGFSPDLAHAGFVIDEPPLAAGALEGNQNLYSRDNTAGTLAALTQGPAPAFAPVEKQGLDSFCARYAGSSADGSRSYFAANGAFAQSVPSTPAGTGFSLYERSLSGLALISVLPDGAAAAPGEQTRFGDEGIACTMDQGSIADAVSSDGSVVFWTYGTSVRSTIDGPGSQTLAVNSSGEGPFTLAFDDKQSPPLTFGASAAQIEVALAGLPSIGAGNVEVAGSNPYAVTFKGPLATTEEPLEGKATPLLFARLGGETIQLDARVIQGVKITPGPPGNGKFRGASPDGHFAFFSAPGSLLPGMSATGALYRYDTVERKLISLTGTTLSPELLGTIGFSADGTYAYFVAEAVLAENQGPSGQSAEEGANNLYLWHEGEGLRFIGRLGQVEERDWSFIPEELSARVTPDGKHLAFLSSQTGALAGYDNTVAEGTGCQIPPGENRDSHLEGSPLCLQAMIYDATAETLTCASCNPSGARPAGPTVLLPWSNPLEGPRYLSDDGSRLFFESFDALIGADRNGVRDVYEFEASGSGTCDSQSPTHNSTTNGCLHLISNGKSERPSYFIDASSEGRDVFFTTRARLVGWDTDQNYDIYDARQGGGFPEPPLAPPVCEGEGCKAPPAAPPPPGPSPGTATFQGPGNKVSGPAKRCRKGKVRRGGRCVRRCPKGKARAGKRCVKPKQKRRAGQRRAEGGTGR